MDSYTYYHGGHSIKVGADINFVKEAADQPVQRRRHLRLPDRPARASRTTARSARSAARRAAGDDDRQALHQLHAGVRPHRPERQAELQRVAAQLLRAGHVAREQRAALEPRPAVRLSGAAGAGRRHDRRRTRSAGNPRYPLTTHFNQDKNNFGPRIGFTYDFGGKHDTVVARELGHVLRPDEQQRRRQRADQQRRQPAVVHASRRRRPARRSTRRRSRRCRRSRACKPNINVLSADLQRPTIQMVDLTVDRRIMGDVTVSASYLYSHGANLPVFRDINFARRTRRSTSS